MNSVVAQRKKTVVLAACIAIFSVAASQLLVRLHGGRYEKVIVFSYALFMLSMLVYVSVNLVRLKRMQRGGQ